MNNNLEIVLREPELPENWNYNESVKKVKNFVYKWKNLTIEIANELSIARTILSVSPADRPRTTTGAFAPMDKTWGDYCRDIGNNKSTVNRWLARWFNKKDNDKELEDGNYKPLPNGIEIIDGDFRNHTFKNVDLILTDPPYPEEYLDLWGDLSLWAYEVLKPSGWLVAYSGQYYLQRVLLALDEHLTYYWTMAITLPGKTQIVNGRNVMCGWKPLLIFQKPPLKKNRTFYDIVISPQGEKELHEWQQSEGGVRELIKIFSKKEDTIVDPFSGAGTFPLVAYQMQRKAIGIEVDKQTADKSRRRINDET